MTINNTCTAGTINITGHGTVVDNNGGTTVNDYSVPTATEIIDEWETQSQADPTGFHVNVKEVNGTPQTANDNGADINAIKAKTDNQPAGIPKNVAYSNFEFVMISSTNHINPQQNLTSFTAEISKDGGAFASLTNSVSEVGKGVYKVDLTQAEMNASMITLSFQATGADPRLVTMATSA